MDTWWQLLWKLLVKVLLVAGDVRFIERRGTVGRDASLKSLLASARLRFIGLRGGVADTFSLYSGLCEHFQTTDPSSFHFFAIEVRVD